MSSVLGIGGVALYALAFIKAVAILNHDDSWIGFLILGCCIIGAIMIAGANHIYRLESSLKNDEPESNDGGI